MKENLEIILAELWENVKRDFNHPAVAGAELVDFLEKQDTASFDFIDRKIRISRNFLLLMQPRFSPRESLELALKHEVGHWTFFPRELSHHLYLISEAEALGKEKAISLYPIYSDIVNELSILHNGLGGKEFIDAREHFAQNAIKKKDLFSEIIQRLMSAIYGETFKGLGYTAPLAPEEKEYFEKIKDIPYIPSSILGHVASFYRFYKALEPLIPEPPKLDLGFYPIGDIKDISHKELDKSLSDILRELGPGAYKRVREYLKKVRPDFKDPFSSASSGKSAGLDKGDFKLHDELIPFYKRWASTFGVYIVKRPMEKDCQTHYKSERKEYEVGSPLHNIDIFGSRGIIGIPGITKIFTEEEGITPVVEWSVPHALIGIDSSSSMDHPNYASGAIQVLAAAIIGKNYHTNGSFVGGWNFSEDIKYLPPQRNLDDFYSLICGYWGGGTKINMDKLFNILESMKFEEKSNLYHLERQNKEKLLSILSEENRKKALDKSLNIKVDNLRLQCSKLDNILITDGHIANAKEVLSYLSSLGTITRNFVFLTDREKYEEWSKLNIPNTFIYSATEKKDLISLALGRSRSLVQYSPSQIQYKN